MALVGTFCGVFRRQALDRGAAKLGVNKMVTGELSDAVILMYFIELRLIWVTGRKIRLSISHSAKLHGDFNV